MAHPVLVSGSGPGVILMHELPGFVPEFWRLARWIEAAGFTVYAPALYEGAGTPLEELHHIHGRVGGMARACISREIRLFAKDGGSPVSDWLRALARHIHSECGGPGVAGLPDADRMAGAVERAEASARLMDSSVRDAVDALTAALKAMNAGSDVIEDEADAGA